MIVGLFTFTSDRERFVALAGVNQASPKTKHRPKPTYLSLHSWKIEKPNVKRKLVILHTAVQICVLHAAHTHNPPTGGRPSDPVPGGCTCRSDGIMGVLGH